MKRGNKYEKAQVSAFIIVGIFIVVAIVIFFFLRMKGNGDGPGIFASQIDVVKYSIEQCGKDTTREGMKRIGIQGGFYNAPDHVDDLGWAFIPYYYLDHNIYNPNLTEIQDQLSFYIDDKMDECIKSIYSKEYVLDFSKPITKTTITKGKIDFSIDLPITIKKGDSVNIYQMKDNAIVYNSSLYDIYEISDFITKSHKENDTKMCINCILEMAKERDLYVDFIDYKPSTTLVMLSENYTYKEPYLFEFLNKY